MNRLKSATENEVISKLSKDKNFTDNIIYYNTTEQLYNEGVDANNKTLGQYAASTIEGTTSFLGKKAKGQPFDHITLRDTGAFYNSFKVVKTQDGLLIQANSIKDDTDLRVEYGKDIVGLTEESLSKVILEAKLKTVLFIKNRISTR